MSLNRKQRRKLKREVANDIVRDLKTRTPEDLIAVSTNTQNIGVINRNKRQYDPSVFLSAVSKSLPTIKDYRQIETTSLERLPTYRMVYTPVNNSENKKQSNHLMVCMIGLPAIVCHEYYHYNDEQISDIVDEIIEYYDGMFKDYFSFDDVDTVLSEEANLVITDVAAQMNVFKSAMDHAFLVVIGTAVMTMLDKFNFDDEKCRDFTEKMIYKYDYYKRGYITDYELIRFLKTHANVTLEI